MDSVDRSFNCFNVLFLKIIYLSMYLSIYHKYGNMVRFIKDREENGDLLFSNFSINSKQFIKKGD